MIWNTLRLVDLFPPGVLIAVAEVQAHVADQLIAVAMLDGVSCRSGGRA